MHLLAAKPGGFIDDEGIVDLQQTAGDIVILSAQDTSLGLLAEVADAQADSYPSLRLANLMHLAKPAAYDLYEHSVLQHAKLIIVALLGGLSYWRYGIDQLVALSDQHNIPLIVVPGDDQADHELAQLCRCPLSVATNVWQYLRHGGVRNSDNLLRYLQQQFFPNQQQTIATIAPPWACPRCVIYQPGEHDLTLERWRQSRDPLKPTALLLFYRSHLQSGNTAAFDQLIAYLANTLNVLALATLSLKDQICLQTINHLLTQIECNIVINTTSFSQRIEGNAALSSTIELNQQPLFSRDIAVIQAIVAASDRQHWQQSAQGLRARDIAMNVALPEYDGHIISRTISFKQPLKRSQRTQTDIVRYGLHHERAQFVAELATRWASLCGKKNRDKSIVLILANYPTKDGRIGNGVGLDTPASVINILQTLASDGYQTDRLPTDGDALIQQLLQGVTNDLDQIAVKPANQSLDATRYQQFFSQMPRVNQQAVLDRWGGVEKDPKYRAGRIIVSGLRLDNVFVAIQPARGFNIDLTANYHDPDLVPPHGYLAFYFWLRHVYRADAIMHVGKHGNLEWLPGKSVGLSQQCWPDIALGAMPHLYPFIVNDPGEGTQAKRRAQAVIIDHLMPPLARADSYGACQQLELLMDEYYQAIGLDPRRENLLHQQIFELLEQSHLLQELGFKNQQPEPDDALLGQVDAYLCDLKEAQIRHGLHRFGELPAADKIPETLIALVRLPRGEQAEDQGILHTLSDDLGLLSADDCRFDPLNIDAGAGWRGKRPAQLAAISADQWRTAADTRERLEQLALALVTALIETNTLPQNLPATRQLLGHIQASLIPALQSSATNELKSIVNALNGGFVPPGPSGAPSRGRLDTLPTGRNFYSLDARSIPTKAAWQLGQQSAEQLILKHLQEKGDYPQKLGISVWGTATMRTGGDDIAQALALMGVQPVWMPGSNRVIDIEIIPGFQLDRPRVDVTLRISGFFRDAFPNVARLFDSAVQALADYQEPGDSNIMRQNMLRDAEIMIDNGITPADAHSQSRLRIFGAKPGSYGAGLQGLIDQRLWNDKADLAQAYVNWGGYSYSKAHFGKAAFSAFRQRLSTIEAVVQNQDNREHDLLDSDDYYQFQGGMANAVEVLSGEQPAVYHGDHSNPAKPVMRTLKQELNRVIRSRVVNPKWISAMQQHGYKGAFEMAASVDYLFAYDATTNLIDDYQYAAVSEAFLLAPDNRAFLNQHNPHALKEMAEKLIEAQQRGLWQQPGDYAEKITDVLLQVENAMEQAGDNANLNRAE